MDMKRAFGVEMMLLKSTLTVRRFAVGVPQCVCVLTCPPAGEAVSISKAYQSPLDVPPPA